MSMRPAPPSCYARKHFLPSKPASYTNSYNFLSSYYPDLHCRNKNLEIWLSTCKYMPRTVLGGHEIVKDFTCRG